MTSKSSEDQPQPGTAETADSDRDQPRDLTCEPQQAVDQGDADSAVQLDLLLSVYDTLLDRYMPPLILIDGRRRVIDTFAGADRFLRFGSRRPSQNLLELLIEPLRSPVADACSHCGATGQSVLTEPIVVTLADSIQDPLDRGLPATGDAASFDRVRARVTPVPHRRSDLPFFSVQFEPAETSGTGLSVALPVRHPEAQKLSRRQVDFTRNAPSVVREPGEWLNRAAGEADGMLSLIELTGVAVIFLDGDLRIRRFTRPAGRLFGLLPHDIGRPIQTFAGAIESTDMVDRLRQVIQTGDADEFEIHQPKLGKYIVARAVSGGGNVDDGLVLTLIDLSSQEQRHREVQQLSSIVHSSADAIISRDCDNRIVTWNAAAEEMYGYAADEVIGKTIDLLVPDTESVEQLNVQRVFGRDPHIDHFESSRKTKGGKLTRVSVRLSPIYDDENRVVGLSTIERDMSEKVELVAKLSQSERILQAYYEQSPELYCTLDISSGLITDCNEAMVRRLEVPKDEIVGRSVLDFQTEATREKARHCIERLRETGMLHGEELELRRSGGEALPVSLCATGIFDTGGRIVGARGVWRDLSALRVKDELIRKGEARYRQAFQTSAIGIAHCDLDGKYTLANKRLCDILGYSFEELSRLTFGEITHPEDLSHELELRRRLIAGEIDTYKLEKRYVRRSGGEVWVSVFVSLERDSGGKPYASHSYVEDISSRKELESELRSAIQQRDQFLAMLSHELRNPLGAILNTCAVVTRRKGFAKPMQNAISIVTRQARQMADLLDDLLDVSRITTGKIKLEKTPIDLAQVADEAIESQQSLAASRGQRLAVTYCDEALQVFGDRSRLVQVVVNLLNNAIKYTGDGGLITVTLEKMGRTGRIRVKDNGVGLEPEQIESLFEMFAQKNATLDRSGGGMGLGLHLVRKLVDFHSGRVIGRSEGLGKGSEFIVELPLSSRRSAADRTGPVPRLPRRSKVKRIVVVEDIDDARNMLVALLEADNYQVSSAADGEAGLQMILREQPDLAIVDIGLPKLDGYQVAREVRTRMPESQIRLIALTGYGQESDHELVINAGFDTHLVKPLNHTRLEKILAGT